MYGTHVNTLLVYLKPSTVQGLGTNIWKQTGDQGNKWILGEVTIAPSSPSYKVHYLSVKQFASMSVPFFN